MSRRRIAAGVVRRSGRCSLSISAETLAAAGYPTLQAAHDDAVCARLWAAERRGNGAGPDDDPVEPS